MRCIFIWSGRSNQAEQGHGEKPEQPLVPSSMDPCPSSKISVGVDKLFPALDAVALPDSLGEAKVAKMGHLRLGNYCRLRYQTPASDASDL